MLDLYPKLSLTGNFGRIGSEITDLLDGDLTQWGLLTNLAVPIFDSGRRHATLAAHEARLQEATELFASSVLVACAEVESALENEGWLREQVAHLETAAQEARVALTLAREQYTSGLVGVLFVLESERLAFNADSALIAVRRMLFQNRVNLHLALGGGFGSAADEEQATADSETVMDEASESATEERG